MNIKKILFIIILLLIGIYNVSAKDISYSINKYDDEIFKYIEKGYDKDLKEDGYVLGGNFLKEKIEQDDVLYNDYQVILAKYNNKDKLIWKYTYGDTKEDYIDCLTYTYDESGNIDGYLIITKKTGSITDNTTNNNSVLLKINFDGKLVWEKEIFDGSIIKIIPTYNSDNLIDGYVSIMNNESGSSLVKYDKNFEVISKRDFLNTTLKDLTLIKEDEKIIGYAVIQDSSLIGLDINGYSDVVLDDLSKYKSSNLLESNNGFILYGITSEVKLKKGDSSYYLINYVNNEQKWETIGNTSVSKNGKIILLPIYKNNIIEEYLLMYKNGVDSSYEVVKLDIDGNILKKVKKINNNYYDIENFYAKGTTIYFIGQINCPEDDNCEYDNNSLYLVSDEDKVIEVQDNTSSNVIIVFSIIFIILIGGVLIIRKKTKK
ncbi:MAG: hypothetical protein IJ097_03735 [Bacilli bacterium]|nr:hypothetical protein [Bacilli bacterium]